ncbi:hypothetical protein KBC59_00945 [Patescibacteria group bacterium]|nr:hypothetical protein [Patescibacteria group bacterium]
MNTLSKRFAAAFLLAATVLAGAPSLTQAATSPWSWTDVSNQLTVRNNRPVWAMAYGNGNWFYTDGLDLWNGGQVYRFDGYTQVNITTEVRNAGLNRVDEIVTDGTNIIFFKDIFRVDNAVEAIRYRDGSYSNITGLIRAGLDSNEGISSIVGRNGTWMMVSTRARLVRFNENFSSYSRLSVPTEIKQFSSSNSDLLYSAHHRMDRNGGILLAPVGNKFLLLVDFTMHSSTPNRDIVGYLYDGTSFVKTSLPSGIHSFSGIASNDSRALVFGYTLGGHGAWGQLLEFDGTTWKNLDGFSSGGYGGDYSYFKDSSNFLATWTGSEWMIISGKEQYRVVNNSIELVDTLRDYFITDASNNSGTVLLGGAESDTFANGPIFPLQAKLAKLTNGGTSNNGSTSNGTFGGGQTGTSSFGPTLRSMGNPSNFRVGNNGTFIYRLTASDANGVDRIDLYANGARLKTCYSDVCEFESTYFTNGASYRTVPFTGRATDKLGYSTDLPTNDILTIDQSTATAGTNNNNNNSNTQTSNGVSAWSWVEPNQSFLRRDQNVIFGAGSWSDAGIKRIEIVVNGSTRNTCHFANAMGNQQCTYSIWGGEFALGTNVAVNAKITNGNDQTLWTDLKNLNVTDANGSSNNNNNNNTNSNTNVWTWSEPETSQIKTNESAKFFVGASDQDGIQKIELFVNGSSWNTCNLGNAYGNQSCSVTVSGSSFAAGSDVYVNAKITDSQGNTAWSASRTYRIVASNGTTTPTPSGTNPTSSWIWSAPEKTQLAKDETATWNVGAYDNDGLNRIDIWVNGVVKQTCNLGNAVGNRECNYAIRANDYAAGTNVFVNAAIIDSKGETTWSDSRSYAITTSNGNGSSNETPNNLPGSVQVTSNRDNGFSKNDTITVTANAQDQNGLKRIDLLVNGTLYKTCTNVGSCSVTVGPFPQNQTISYGATVVDNAGFAIWTGYKTINKK